VHFHSLGFLAAFLPLALVAFHVAGGAGPRPATLVLLAASAAFYAAYRPEDLPLLAGSMLVNYSAVRMLAATKSRAVLGASVAANVLFLFAFKWRASETAVAPGIPLGISFYTLGQITCLVDSYRGSVKRVRLEQYGLFVAFFPHLLAGPIVRYPALQKQLDDPAFGKFKSQNFVCGLVLLAIGLAKKVLVADNLGDFADPVFHAAAVQLPIASADAWWAAFAYALQIYFDFSGYCDMACGMARMFGVELPANFDSPYRAPNLVEFWRRWHVTLHEFLRDYVFLPLGGGRGGWLAVSSRVFAVFLLSGLWHGIGATFLLWGALHGVLTALSRRLSRPQTAPVRVAGMLFTFVVVAVLFVLFRSPDLDTARRMGSALLAQSAGDTLFPASTDRNARALVVVVSVGLILLAPNAAQIAARLGTGGVPPRRLALYATAFGGLFAAAMFSVFLGNDNEFIYFQF
jgi:D-alanyl-lipoteichoic acid acyltransferase DltB (MBOAT superfamily)